VLLILQLDSQSKSISQLEDGRIRRTDGMVRWATKYGHERQNAF
jgi:hypothetical protein